jgi:ABC-type lipoprotein release transport system permease subunit
MSLFEGTLAALLAAAIGSVLGVGIGAGILSVLNTAFGTSAPETSLVLHYDFSDLLTAFLLGVFITMTTVVLSSFRISRLNIAGALRNLEQPTKKTKRAFVVPLVGVVLIAFSLVLYAISQDSIITHVVAPIVGITGLALIAQDIFTRKLAMSISGALLVLYASYSALANPTDFSNLTLSVVFATRGVLLLVGVLLVVLANANIWLNGIPRLLVRFAGIKSILMPAVAYSSQKRSQFQMTVIIMSVVIFFIVLASVSAAVYHPDIEKQTGGYDIRVTTTEPLTNLTMLQVKSFAPELGTARVALLNESKIDYYDGLFVTNVTGITINGQTTTSQLTEKDAIYGIDANFSEHSRYNFQDTLKGFNSSRDVWDSLNDPRYAVIDSNYVYGANATQVKAGDVVSITTANGTVRLIVAGVLDEYYLHGIFMNKQQMLQYFPAIKGDTLFLIKSEAGMKPIDLSYDLKKGYKIAGINAFLIRDELLQMTRQSQLLFQLMATYLGLGLIVGIASVGVITSRSAIERRREIGIMRAIGFTRSLVAKSLIWEVILAITLALLVGLATGLVFSAAIYLSLNQAVKAPFTVPVAQLALVFVAVYLGTIVWTIIPARKASLVPPAEAIRYVE